MTPLIFAMGMAIWFGILTSISPCPLATNITAISFIGRRIGDARTVFLAGLIYMGGRMVAYTVLGAVLVSSTQLIPTVAIFLQTYMVYLIGPGLILVGLFLLEVFSLPVSHTIFGPRVQAYVESTGIWGAGLLGILFALSFCPISAALFFGSLFSLALQHGSRVLLPALYGVGTAIPVVVFAFILAFSANLLGNVCHKLGIFERWARRITGVVFMLAGCYLCLTQILHLF